MSSQPAATKVSHTARNIAIVAVIVVAGFVALNAIRIPTSQQGGLLPQERSINIVNGLITVQAGGWQAYPFTVPRVATNVHVKGQFTASGGSGNDVIVLIMDETAFINWKNGHQVNVYYNSGKLTTSSISATLPTVVDSSSTFYLVYDDIFSTFASKNVQTTVNLTYTI